VDIGVRLLRGHEGNLRASTLLLWWEKAGMGWDGCLRGRYRYNTRIGAFGKKQSRHQLFINFIITLDKYLSHAYIFVLNDSCVIVLHKYFNCVNIKKYQTSKSKASHSAKTGPFKYFLKRTRYMQIIKSILSGSVAAISLLLTSQTAHATATVDLLPASIYVDVPIEEADLLVDWSVDVPLSQLGSKADQVMDRIIVTGDRWINPQFTDIRNFLRGAPNGSSTPSPSEARPERLRVCTNLAALSKILKCNSVEKEPPRDASYLNIDQSQYSTWLLWQDTIVNLARSIFENQLPASPTPYRDPLNITSEAFREAVGKCNTESRCIRQVYQYFGAAATSLPDVPFIGNINDIVNSYLQATPLAPVLGNSPAGTILQRYGNNTICGRIVDDQKQKGCKT
jgi:hypothetical protein